MKRFPLRFAALALLVAVAGSACSDFESSITNPNEGEPLFSIFFEVPSAEAGASAVPSPDLSVQLTDDEGNSLSLNAGQVVVREMELGRTTGECTDAEPGQEDDNDACQEITITPQLLSLPFERAEVRIVNRFPVVGGGYDRLEFDIHIATEDDQQVVTSNPQLLNESVELQGSFNGSSFALRLDPEAELSLPFGQTIEAEPGSTSQVTLVLDTEDWFRRDDGSLIDPTSIEEDSPLEERVEDQIAGSFSVQLGSPAGS